MPRRDTIVYSMRDSRGRVQKYGVTNSPARRERENRGEGVRGTLRPESRRMTRKSALRVERRRINGYRSRVGRRPPRNRM